MAKGKRASAVRLHSLITYADEKDIQNVIFNHSSSIRSYAYIHHNRDKTEPHYHLVIRTYDAWTQTQLLKWFDNLKLSKNVNTFYEEGGDIGGLHTYLQHKDLKSIEAGKEQYELEEIKDFGLFAEYTEKDSYDGTYEIINAMLNGVPTRTLVRRYGKQLIYHYSQFVAVRDAITQEDHLEEIYSKRQTEKPIVYDQTKLKPIPLDQVDLFN